jgi:hypothetical protein
MGLVPYRLERQLLISSRSTGLLRALPFLVFGWLCFVGCSSSRQGLPTQARQEHSKPLEFSVVRLQSAKEPPVKLMIYGGKQHDVYLGCLNCEASEPESVFNEFGAYGSRYSPYSLWNALTPYGSVSSYMSPRNPQASDPPIVRDQDGRFQGYLTINNHMPQSFRSKEAIALLKRIQGG